MRMRMRNKIIVYFYEFNLKLLNAWMSVRLSVSLRPTISGGSNGRWQAVPCHNIISYVLRWWNTFWNLKGWLQQYNKNKKQ